MATHYECITTMEDLERWDRRLSKSRIFAIDTETTSKNPMEAKLVGVCLSVVENGAAPACYIPVGHTKKACRGVEQLPLDVVLQTVDKHARDAAKQKVFQNAVYDLAVLGRYGIEFENVDDTMVMSYDLTTGQHTHGMDEMADMYLGHRTIKFDEVCPPHELLGFEGFQDVQLEHATEYAAEDTEVTLRLYYDLRLRLKKAGLWHVYENIDRPLIMAVADMKRNGIGLSSKACRALTAEWAVKIDEAAARLQTYAPGINPGSAQQVGRLLFDALGLPVLERTDSGAPSTGIETLELLRDRHDAVDALVVYRKYSKLSSYSSSWPDFVLKGTGRLHPNMNSCFTNTGRFSASGPPVQQVPSPAKSEEGVELRRAFTAPLGYKIIGADYSQIELRVLAHITQDPTLLAAYANGEDVHTRTACTVFGHAYEHFLWVMEEADGKPLRADHPDYRTFKALRRYAKTINFGLVYGMSAYGLSHQLKIDEVTAQEFIDRYFAGMPGVAAWMEREREDAIRNRYVETLYGRRLFLNPGRDRKSTSYAGRQGPNYQIQGSAADLIRLAMVDVRQGIIDADYPANLLLQVHDELLVEAEDAYAERTRNLVEDRMARAGSALVKWSVPILVDAKVGQTWADAH